MSDQVELTNPVDTSVGGMKGHILRRVIHVSMAGIPLLYFGLGETKKIQQIDILWPSGKKQTIRDNIPTNDLLIIEEK